MTHRPPECVPRRGARGGIGSLGRKRKRWFYLLIAPWLIGFVVFQSLCCCGSRGPAFGCCARSPSWLVVLPFALPLLWLVVSAFRPAAEPYQAPPARPPERLAFASFDVAWRLPDFPRFLLKSPLVACAARDAEARDGA